MLNIGAGEKTGQNEKPEIKKEGELRDITAAGTPGVPG